MTIDNLLEQLRALYTLQPPIMMLTPEYRKFHDDLTTFIYEKNLDCTDEWKIISKNLIYKSNQYIVAAEGDIILVQLEKIKRLLLIQKRSCDAIFSYIHPEIVRVSKTSYLVTKYADAVESAFKEVNSRLKKIYKNRTGKEQDGASLMRHAFTLNNPIFIFEDITTQSGKDVQQGYMDIFAGAMTAIRNPKAHANLIITEDNAIRKLMLASDLMYKIDEGLNFEKMNKV